MDTETEIQTQRVYELGYHILPTVKEDEVEKVLAGVRSTIEKQGGVFIAEGAPSMIKLAYAMPKREGEKYSEHDRAYFGWIKFEAATDSAKALEEVLKGHPSMLRSMVFKTVREDTRAKFKAPQLREVKRTDTIKAVRRVEEGKDTPVSEEKLDKAIEDLIVE